MLSLSPDYVYLLLILLFRDAGYGGRRLLLSPQWQRVHGKGVEALAGHGVAGAGGGPRLTSLLLPEIRGHSLQTKSEDIVYKSM